MLGASFTLIAEGAKLSPDRVLVGILIGLAAIVVSNRLIRRRGPTDIADLHGDGAKRALLILGVMTAHSFAEGVGVACPSPALPSSASGFLIGGRFSL
jgi:zinc transporter, ZIP family